MQDNLNKEFKPTSWAIDNKVSIYVATIIIALAGILSYNSLPKEQFPEVVFPQFYISTVYFGTSPEDMETLVTKPIEKELGGISGVKKIKSTSMQDYSAISIEFEAGEDMDRARQEVREKVDQAKKDLPVTSQEFQEPQIIKIDVSQIPIMNVNLSGDFELQQLKEYADEMQDRIEALTEITRVDIVGALDREIQINVDKNKMDAAEIGFSDIIQAIQGENITISGGLVTMGGQKRTLSVKGEYKDPTKIANIKVRGQSGATVYIKDIAEVVDGFKEQESYARLDGKNVITLNVIKQSGKNLIDASDKIQAVIKDMQATYLPKGLNVTITADQSKSTRVTLHDLINTIIIGFVLVTVILMFFMGAVNAIFVALSVPISMFIAFLLMPMYGFTLNMMVLFSFLLALGIVVDDAIVVIENVHRIFYERKDLGIVKAAKVAAGEVFLPVFSGTLTVLAPFVPLLFWPGIIGKFMYFLPVTLITTLGASLIVAYIINPVFAVDFMDRHEGENHPKPKFDKKFKILTAIFGVLALIGYASAFGVGNFVVFVYLLIVLERFWLGGVARRFQHNIWPRVQEWYKRILKWCIVGWRPVGIVIGTFGLLFFSIFLTALRSPRVVFFPQADPNFIYTYIDLPNGTDQRYTDSITHIIENRITKVVGANNPIVESIISNVAKNAGDPSQMDLSTQPQKGKVTVAFVEFGARNGQSTVQYLDKIREAVKGIPGADITVEQEQGGPPTGKPINIEITGDNFDDLTATSFRLKRYLDSLQIGGVEELKSDFQSDKPEIVVSIDRERANQEGISTGQIGSTLRTALYGTEASKFRDAKDDYEIMVRLREDQRNNINTLMNLNLVYRDMNMGGAVRKVPLSAVADIKFSNTYAGIKRIDQKRVITLYSNVLTGYNANEIVQKIQQELDHNFTRPNGVTVRMTGEQEDQMETMNFLMLAMLGAFGLILMIMVTQFNSIGRPLIIFMEILFSIIGVFLGFAIFGMDISIVMTGVGIMALAGIVVRNGIVLVEFTDLLIQQGTPVHEAVVEAGKTRMTPVILTAIAAILGLIPLAVGLNIDFAGLFSRFDPHIFFGGDNVAFWGPLAWTMVYGLVFATFLTLILVPVMYAMNKRSIDVLDYYNLPRGLKYVPFLVLILKLFMKKETVRKLHDLKYVSPKPYEFFNGVADAEEKEHAHQVKGISVN
ncbi:efflux RND transporter permease subunit [Chitinophaga defluvii]|uniref:Efflux RND transporter permease subunit n=1 Tax=Chitinophaga defluvii TaxID=3163343 RepID=A0ABV2T7N5_9BACT